MTSDADLNRAAADLAVFDRRKTPLRRIGVRRKDRPAERTSHLDLFFEVHKKNLTRKARRTRNFFCRKRAFLWSRIIGWSRRKRWKTRCARAKFHFGLDGKMETSWISGRTEARLYRTRGQSSFNPACERAVRGPWCRSPSAMSQRARRRGERCPRMPHPAFRSVCLRAGNPSEAEKRDNPPT